MRTFFFFWTFNVSKKLKISSSHKLPQVCLYPFYHSSGLYKDNFSEFTYLDLKCIPFFLKNTRYVLMATDKDNFLAIGASILHEVF